MTIKTYPDLIQGSDEWHQIRCGMITASEVKLLLTPTLKQANNDKSRAHIWELAAQRITGYVEPSYISDDMLRGHDDEVTARDLYRKHIAPVEETGFVTNDSFGFMLGCSPDGLVGDDGMIECKSRRQKYQVKTIVENWRDDTVPDEYALQVQTGLMVTERKWCDLVSFSGGLPMVPMRVYANEEMQAAIREACEVAEEKIEAAIRDFELAVAAREYLATERRIEEEMVI